MPYLLFVNCSLKRSLYSHQHLRKAVFLEECFTANNYCLHSINDTHPGMYQLNAGETGGASIAGELYQIDDDVWQGMEAMLPPHSYRGIVTLDDGSEVYGLLYIRELAEGRYPDITHYGSWQAYIESKSLAA